MTGKENAGKKNQWGGKNVDHTKKSSVGW